MSYRYEKFEYEKSVKINSFVFVSVTKWGWNEKEKRWVELRNIDSKFYFFPFKREERAHRWADELIRKCLKYETGSETYA